MKNVIVAVIIIILMLLGFWYYMGKRCAEVEMSHKLALKTAVQRAVDSVHAHAALNIPLVTYEAPKKIEQPVKVSPKKKKPVEKKEDPNLLVDSRDGQKYKTVQIGDQIWMAQNLNFNVANSVCYEGVDSNCKDFGRLYSWSEAMVACPEGWHLPTDAEWTHLIDFNGGIMKAGGALREGGSSGFNALLAGYHDKAGFYGKIGESSYHWSATAQNDNYASFKGIYKTVDNMGAYTYDKKDRFSVRCIKD